MVTKYARCLTTRAYGSNEIAPRDEESLLLTFIYDIDAIAVKLKPILSLTSINDEIRNIISPCIVNLRVAP